MIAALILTTALLPEPQDPPAPPAPQRVAWQRTLEDALADTRCNFLVMSFNSDWRFSPERSREIVNALVQVGRNVSYAEIDTPKGHDAFLLPIPEYRKLFGAYMGRVAEATSNA